MEPGQEKTQQFLIAQELCHAAFSKCDPNFLSHIFDSRSCCLGCQTIKNNPFILSYILCLGSPIPQETHRTYRQKLEELTALQTLCSSSINKQKTRLKDLQLTLQR